MDFLSDAGACVYFLVVQFTLFIISLISVGKRNVLFEYVQDGAIPVVDVRDDEFVLVELQFAPTGNGNAGTPGEGGRPVERPARFNGIVVAMDVVQIHFRIAKPGIDEINRLLIAIETPEFVEGVFEIYVLGVDAVGLIPGKSLIVLFEDLDNIHWAGRKGSLYIYTRGVAIAPSFHLQDLRKFPIEPLWVGICRPPPLHDRVSSA